MNGRPVTDAAAYLEKFGSVAGKCGNDEEDEKDSDMDGIQVISILFCF